MRNYYIETRREKRPTSNKKEEGNWISRVLSRNSIHTVEGMIDGMGTRERRRKQLLNKVTGKKIH
jgi:coenzyme F420-reducing hydrogenase alpha subunit